MRPLLTLLAVLHTTTASPISMIPTIRTDTSTSLSMVNNTAIQVPTSTVNLVDLPLTFGVPNTAYKIAIIVPAEYHKIPEMAMWLVLDDLARTLRVQEASTRVDEAYREYDLGFGATLLPLPVGKSFVLNCGDAASAIDALWAYIEKHPVLMRSLVYTIYLGERCLASGSIMTLNDASKDGQGFCVEEVTIE